MKAYRLNTSDLTPTLFLLGTRTSQEGFTCSGIELKSDCHATYAWTSEAAMRNWLLGQENESEYFEIEAAVAIGILLTIENLRYLIIDPSPIDGISKDDFDIASMPQNRLLDLSRMADVWPAFSTFLKRHGFDEELLQKLWTYTEAHSELLPAEAAKRFLRQSLFPLSLPDSVQHALEDLFPLETCSSHEQSQEYALGLIPPPNECPNCGETEWELALQRKVTSDTSSHSTQGQAFFA